MLLKGVIFSQVMSSTETSYDLVEKKSVTAESVSKIFKSKKWKRKNMPVPRFNTFNWDKVKKFNTYNELERALEDFMTVFVPADLIKNQGILVDGFVESEESVENILVHKELEKIVDPSFFKEHLTRKFEEFREQKVKEYPILSRVTPEKMDAYFSVAWIDFSKVYRRLK